MTTLENLRAISANDLAILAVDNVAYIRKVEIEGQPMYAIHAANGDRLGLAAGREAAFATVLANDLTPVSVH
jgi:hypothetical protein